MAITTGQRFAKDMKTPSAVTAVNLALAAGFEIERHGRLGQVYVRHLRHADGRSIRIQSDLAGRMKFAQGGHGSGWHTRALMTRSIPALTRLLDAGQQAVEYRAELAARSAGTWTR
jgi:hypothetical protein